MTVGNFSPSFFCVVWAIGCLGTTGFLSTNCVYCRRVWDLVTGTWNVGSRKTGLVNTAATLSTQNSRGQVNRVMICCPSNVGMESTGLRNIFLSLVTVVTNKQVVLTMVHSKVSRTDYISLPSTKMLTVFSMKHDEKNKLFWHPGFSINFVWPNSPFFVMAWWPWSQRMCSCSGPMSFVPRQSLGLMLKF